MNTGSTATRVLPIAHRFTARAQVLGAALKLLYRSWDNPIEMSNVTYHDCFTLLQISGPLVYVNAGLANRAP